MNSGPGLANSPNGSSLAPERGSLTTINCDINYLIYMELFPLLQRSKF
jgi:hypothetical protein